MMNWLPVPVDFRTELRSALQVVDPATRLDRLASLAQNHLGFIETIQLDRAIGQLAVDSSPGFSQVRLAILASSTVDHLIPGIRVAGLRHGLLIQVHIGAYGQYRQDLLDNSSPLHRFAPQIVLFALTARTAIAGVPLTATLPEVHEALDRSVADLQFLWRKARTAFNTTVIHQTFLDVTDPVFGSFDRHVPGSPSQLVSRLNDKLAESAASEAVLLLDIARAAQRDGRDSWFDNGRWLQAKQEISPQAAPLYGELLARIVAAGRGHSKKCLVLDLDNTLWHGVIGEDGLQGIVLGEGSAVGEAHLSLQRYAKQLMDRGIILAVCSKNDIATAEEAFKSHPEMILKRTDFAAFMANWIDKAENLKAIARQLNLGLDSLVFVDDNPAERSRIRRALPMVAVPELPSDAAGYVRCIADAGYFESVSFTSDDQQRSAQYAANAARETLRGSAENIDDFLHSLEMTMESRSFAPVDLTRITQLINKTNQFNPTTRRYTINDIARLVAGTENLTLQFRLADRFGDNGLVSAMILLRHPKEQDVLVIDTWVMSCRVFGRQVEFEAMNIAVEAARRLGVRGFRAEYVPTAKNGVVRELFPNLGFNSAARTVTSNGATGWFLNLADYVDRRTHIARRWQHDQAGYPAQFHAHS
jgi:FkbH-like protein